MRPVGLAGMGFHDMSFKTFELSGRKNTLKLTKYGPEHGLDKKRR
jgi:hypothetical protein